MLAYIDSSLLLVDILEDRPILPDLMQGVAVTTSQITSIEIARTLHRELKEADIGTITSQVLGGFDLVGLSTTVLDAAMSLPVRFLRALDAIHLASAIAVRADFVLTRDHQMQRACEELGLAVA